MQGDGTPMRDSGQVHCSRSEADNKARLSLRGSVGILIADELLAGARDVADMRNVSIDLSEAEHLDLAGWQVLLSLKRTLEAAGGRLELEAVPDALQRYLRISGLDRELDAAADDAGDRQED